MIRSKRSRGTKNALGWVDALPLAVLLAPIVAIVAMSSEMGPACATLGGPLDARLVNYILEWEYLQIQGAGSGGSLWSPPFFFPVPHVLAYSENFLAGSLLYVPLRWVGVGPSAALFVFHLVQRALTPWIAYLCLRVLRLGRWPSFVGAAVFSWGWIRYFHYGHIQFSAGFPIPLFFTALYFAVHRRRPWAMVLVAWTFLFTWYFSLYTAVFLAFGVLTLAAVGLVLPGGRRQAAAVVRSYRRFATACPRQATAIGISCLLAVALVLPSAAVYAEIQREFGAVSEIQLRTYWGDVFSWVRPPTAHPVLGSFESLFPEVRYGRWEKNAFVGWLGLAGLLLPGVGFLLRGRRIYSLWPRSLVVVSVSGAAIILLFSSYGGRWLEIPFLFLLRHLPGLGGLRAPTRIAFVVAWLVVLCLAAHLRRLSRPGSPRGARRRRWAAWGLGLALLVENLAPLPRIVDRCADEAIWDETAEHLCPRIPRDEIGTLLFLPMDMRSIQGVVQQTLAMRLSQSCDLQVVNGYSGRLPPLITPLLESPPEAFPCQAAREVVDRVHQASDKGMLIHLDHQVALGPAGYPASAVRECLRPCLAPDPSWFVQQPGRSATALVTDASAACQSGEPASGPFTPPVK